MKAWARAFYFSKSWEQCREAYLISQQHICERCGDIAKVVHHKTYLTPDNINDASISLNWDNLEALCQDCHNKEHHKEDKRRYAFDDDGNVIPKASGCNGCKEN